MVLCVCLSHSPQLLWWGPSRSPSSHTTSLCGRCAAAGHCAPSPWPQSPPSVYTQSERGERARTHTRQKMALTQTEYQLCLIHSTKERETNPDAYKKSLYALRRTIKQAKRQYRMKIKSYYTGSDAHRRQGLQTIMDLQKGNPNSSCPVTRAYQTS